MKTRSTWRKGRKEDNIGSLREGFTLAANVVKRDDVVAAGGDHEGGLGEMFLGRKDSAGLANEVDFFGIATVDADDVLAELIGNQEAHTILWNGESL